MKNTHIFISIFLIALLSFSSCVSSSKQSPADEKPAETVTEEKKRPEKPKAEKTAEELEYERATKDLVGETVSKDIFEKDKAEILNKIEELNVIMKNRSYSQWLRYIEPNSINYWSQKKNLNAASKQLPVKGIQLKSLEDYFNYVFIPSRMGKQIDEIRYISSSSIKAVQVRESTTVIFYNFKKINGDWRVELPPL